MKKIKPETKELIVMTSVFIYMGIVVFLTFKLDNYWLLLLLIPLVFGQLTIEIVRGIRNKHLIKKSIKNGKLKYKEFKKMYERIYEQIENEEILKSRFWMRLLYVIYTIMFVLIISCFAVWYCLGNNKLDVPYDRYKDLLFVLLALNLIMLIVLFVVKVLKNKNPDYKEEYRSKYKKQIIREIIEQEGRFEYDDEYQQIGYHQENYKNLNFDNATFNRFEMDDMIRGNLDDMCSFEMYGLYAYYYRRYIDDGREKEIEYVVFRGTYVILDVGKTFDYIKVVRNKFNLFDKEDLLKIDNKIFNKYLEIHTENKESARQILKKELINHIAKFAEKSGIQLDMVFKDKIYIRFHTENIFEPKIWGNIVDEISMYKYYTMIEFLEGFCKIIRSDEV